MAALAIGLFGDLGSLNVTETDDGCWRPVPEYENRTFDSEQELKNFASNNYIEIPEALSFKTIDGTLHQEAECIGGSTE